MFSIITPVFSVTWFFRNHSNMMICCLRNIYFDYQCWKQLCCLIILWKLWFIFFFNILWWIESSKEQHLFVIEIFCNIINDFTVTLVKVRVNRKFATVFTSVLWHTSEINRILNEENRGHCLFFYCELIGCSKNRRFIQNNVSTQQHWQLEGRGSGCPAHAQTVNSDVIRESPSF